MTLEQPSASASLIERVKNILLQPQTEWDRIEKEPTDAQKLIVGYVLPLAALAALCGLIGMSVFGYGAFGVHVRVPMTAALVTAVLQLVMAVVGVFVLGFIINALAPTFGSRQDQNQAIKVAAYSMTASWLAGVFAIWPPIAALGIVGLYSFVLLFMGLPRLMQTPADKKVGYFATVLIVAIIVFVVIGAITASVQGALSGGARNFGFGMQSPAITQSENADITINGNAIDLSEIERAAKQIEQAASEGGAAPTIDPATLAALLPENLPGGYAVASRSSGSGGAAGFGAAQAEATYANASGGQVTVTIVHMGAMSGLATMAGAMNVQSNEENQDGFARTRSDGGRVYTEEMSRSAGTAGAGVVGRNGAAINVEGTGGFTVEQAKAVIDAIGVERVEAIAGSNG